MPFSFWLKTQTSNFKLFLSTEGTEVTEKRLLTFPFYLCIPWTDCGLQVFVVKTKV
jgi:hypothetical protein